MLYRFRSALALRRIFDYRVSDLTRPIFKSCVAESKDIGLGPAEAAAMFMEACCFSMMEPLDLRSRAFLTEKIDLWLQAMRLEELLGFNCVRVARLYAYACGAAHADASEFAQRTVGDICRSRGLLSADGTEFGVAGFRMPLLYVLAVEFKKHCATAAREGQRAA